MDKQYAVYIFASKRNGTLYIGLTNDLTKRVWEHKNDFVEGFTKKYRVHQLVHFEIYTDVRDALKLEKNLKHWKRQWKLRLIEEQNPNWRDLYAQII